MSRHWILNNKNSYNWEMGEKWGIPVYWVESICRCGIHTTNWVEPRRIPKLRKKNSREPEENEEARIYQTEYWREDSYTYTPETCIELYLNIQQSID